MSYHRSFKIIFLDLITLFFAIDWIGFLIIGIILINHTTAETLYTWKLIYENLNWIFHGFQWLLGYDMIVIVLYLILTGLDSRITWRKKIVGIMGVAFLAPVWIPIYWYRRFVQVKPDISAP